MALNSAEKRLDQKYLKKVGACPEIEVEQKQKRKHNWAEKEQLLWNMKRVDEKMTSKRPKKSRLTE